MRERMIQPISIGNGELTPFQRLEWLARKIIAVPKKEANKVDHKQSGRKRKKL
jgi:hypothetical protein